MMTSPKNITKIVLLLFVTMFVYLITADTFIFNNIDVKYNAAEDPFHYNEDILINKGLAVTFFIVKFFIIISMLAGVIKSFQIYMKTYKKSFDGTVAKHYSGIVSMFVFNIINVLIIYTTFNLVFEYANIEKVHVTVVISLMVVLLAVGIHSLFSMLILASDNEDFHKRLHFSNGNSVKIGPGMFGVRAIMTDYYYKLYNYNEETLRLHNQLKKTLNYE
tara:strand:+ start:107 stop:763 length:657 start_codon:yes stop_codon:yes gene_type:complete